MLCQLLRRQTRAKVAIPLAHNRHRESANLSGQPVVAGLAAALGKQARGAVLLAAAPQANRLTPLQADQRTGVTDTQATRPIPQQHVKTAELLLAHRHHRHGAPPGTPEPGDVSPLSCRGVSSLYCAYTIRSNLIVIGKTSSVETTSPMASSERILRSRDYRMLKCASAIITGSAMPCSK